MASIIRIKRSSGTNKPASLNWGEMGYVTGIGSYGGTNQYKDRIFVGDDGSNVFPVGGHYYTSMMEHTPGTVAGVSNTRNSDGGIVAVLDDNRKVDQWNVDNLRMDGNVISSTDTDGNVIFDPNGTGEVNIVDDTFLSFGTDKDVKFEYDEDGTDRLLVSGKEVMFNTPLNVSTHSQFGKIKIDSNIISTVSGAGDKLFIDPFPDGLSNQGDVIIKGNLQVDGTTTSVNSTNVTVNDPIFTIGDVTSERTVMQSVATGISTIILDSVVGINTGDIISGNAALPNSGLTTVTTYDVGAKMITVEGSTTAGITTTSQLTVTHAFDTNTDRGIAFNYNTGIGTANSKTGFFGYVDQDTNTASSAPANSWTYVPDATVTGSLVNGTRGFLDIKGIYYQTADYNTHGAVYFDENGLQTSTNNPASPIITSKQILTAVTKNTLALASNVTVAVGDIVRQDTSGAYGVVETGGTNINSLDLVGVEGTFTNTYNIRKEGENGSIQNLAVIPATVSVIYTNKPHWSSTLDGGTF
ncbi:MAG: hypothetical protein CBD88_06675 [Flavobacteriales bacterium TMED228]|nr:MAG: hypothetical protein CBD88_06675 [Flavobacteriales bacterium TMED228]